MMKMIPQARRITLARIYHSNHKSSREIPHTNQVKNAILWILARSTVLVKVKHLSLLYHPLKLNNLELYPRKVSLLPLGTNKYFLSFIWIWKMQMWSPKRVLLNTNSGNSMISYRTSKSKSLTSCIIKRTKILSCKISIVLLDQRADLF